MTTGAELLAAAVHAVIDDAGKLDRPAALDRYTQCKEEATAHEVRGDLLFASLFAALAGMYGEVGIVLGNEANE